MVASWPREGRATDTGEFCRKLQGAGKAGWRSVSAGEGPGSGKIRAVRPAVFSAWLYTRMPCTQLLYDSVACACVCILHPLSLM